MGTPQIAADVLERLIAEKANVVLAVCQPDRKVGRKGKVVFPAVKELALQHNIPVFQPERIRSDFQPIQDAKADLIVTCAYGQIVPQQVLEAPVYGCVNLHGSLLPEYRGAAPIQRAIWDGRKESGMSLMQMEKGMDTGGVMDTQVILLEDDETSSTLFEKMGQAAGDLIARNLPTLLAGQAEFTAQNPEDVSYAAMISRDEEMIDFNQPDWRIDGQIRALADEPGAYGIVNGKKLKILKAKRVDGKPIKPGMLHICGKKKMLLDLHDQQLELERVQLEGKPAMKIADFMNGYGRQIDGAVMKGRVNENGSEA